MSRRKNIQDLNIFQHLKDSYSGEYVREVKKLINLNKKLIKAKNDREFIVKCIQQELIPKFLRFKLSNSSLANSRKTYEFKKSLLEEEKRRKNKLISNIHKEISTINKSVVQQLKHEIDWVMLDNFIQKNNEKVNNQTIKKQDNKLRDLELSNRFGLLDMEEIELSGRVLNISNTQLSDKEEKALSRGLKFAFKPKKVDEIEILTSLEVAVQRLEFQPILDNKLGLNKELKLDSKQAFLQNLKKEVSDLVEAAKKSENNLDNEELKTLINLSKNKNLVISKADKGNAVVVQNKSDYVKKVKSILEDGNKFKILDEDPTIDREEKLQKKLYYMFKFKNSFGAKTYARIRPVGSRSGVMYGLPKIHKKDAPIRPIISSIGTYTYKLAEYLDEILKPISNESRYSLKDTFDFCNKIKELNKSTNLKNSIMVSFDVSSLFTNIPTNESIDLIIKKAFNKKYTKDTLVGKKRVPTFQGLEEKDLKKTPRNISKIFSFCV